MRDVKIATLDSKNILEQTNELIDKTGLVTSVFKEIYDLWFTKVYQYSYARVGNQKDAEDITSQIFLKAIEAFPRYKHRGHFPAWLFTIARNEIKMFYRGKKKSRTVVEVGKIASLTPDLLNSLINSGDIKQLNELITRMPDKEKELIYLRYVAEMKFTDMAVVLGRKESAVKKSLYRLQTRLQNIMEENHD